MEKCLNPDETKREWRRRFFVLKKALGSGTQTLEYFKDKEWRKQEPKGVLTLFSGYTVYKVLDPKKKLTFEVKTMDSFFVLSAATEELRDKWIEALQQNSSGNVDKQHFISFMENYYTKAKFNYPASIFGTFCYKIGYHLLHYSPVSLSSCPNLFQLVQGNCPSPSRALSTFQFELLCYF